MFYIIKPILVNYRPIFLQSHVYKNMKSPVLCTIQPSTNIIIYLGRYLRRQEVKNELGESNGICSYSKIIWPVITNNIPLV